MKIVYGLLALIVIPIAVLLVVERLAAERIEVVELETVDATGEVVITRLWIVDHEGGEYLRVGADGSGWYSRIQQNPTIHVVRDSVRKEYTTASEPEKSLVVNQLMQDKYTWGDTFIGKMFGREGSIPIRLIPVES